MRCTPPWSPSRTESSPGPRHPGPHRRQPADSPPRRIPSPMSHPPVPLFANPSRPGPPSLSIFSLGTLVVTIFFATRGSESPYTAGRSPPRVLLHRSRLAQLLPADAAHVQSDRREQRLRFVESSPVNSYASKEDLV